jgi:short-subunit dehydrogenase
MKKYLIFGATSAIAEATARILASRGEALFLVARDKKKLEAVAGDLKVRGAAQVNLAVMDANDFRKHPGFLAEADKRMGGLDVLLVAHGTLGDQKVSQSGYAETEKELCTNFLSVVSLLTPAANLFETRRHGTLAVISSVAGDRGRQSNYVYGTAKAALSTFLQGLRNRLSKAGVSVVTIKPGVVDTPMTAHMKKGLLVANAETVAKGIVRAMDRGSDVVYLPWFWRPIMFIIRAIPEKLFKKLSL